MKGVMGRLHRFFNEIFAWLAFRRISRPEDIPKKLDVQTLEQAMQEARFLTNRHAVEVRNLLPGELPVPKRADHG